MCTCYMYMYLCTVYTHIHESIPHVDGKIFCRKIFVCINFLLSNFWTKLIFVAWAHWWTFTHVLPSVEMFSSLQFLLLYSVDHRQNSWPYLWQKFPNLQQSIASLQWYWLAGGRASSPPNHLADTEYSRHHHQSGLIPHTTATVCSLRIQMHAHIYRHAYMCTL